MIERIAFGSGYFAKVVYGRLGHLPWVSASFRGDDVRLSLGDVPGRLVDDVNLLALLDPGRFLATPGLWGGLLVAAGFTAGAIWFRRYRDETANG
jgi:hypothetical protein